MFHQFNCVSAVLGIGTEKFKFTIFFIAVYFPLMVEFVERRWLRRGQHNFVKSHNIHVIGEDRLAKHLPQVGGNIIPQSFGPENYPKDYF